MPLYRIAWKTETGLTGWGNYCLSYESAEALVAEMNIKYRKNRESRIYIHHWLEAAL
jgi:hypothetical protein